MNELYIAQLQKRYQGTHIGVTLLDTNTNGVLYVERVHKTELSGLFHTRTTTDKIIAPIAEVKILPPPKTRAFDTVNNCFVYSHAPERQWRVGLCSDNTILQSPCAEAIRNTNEKLIGQMNSFNEPYGNGLHYLFFPKKDKSISEACYQIKSAGKYATNVNRLWSVSLGLNPQTHHLYYLTHLIGIIKNGAITLTDKIFRQEVIDLIHRSGDNYDVI